MGTSYNWQGLEIKLSQGKSLEQAARESLIPFDEAKAYAQAKRDMEQFETDESVLCARAALEDALLVYREILQESEDMDLKLEAAKQLHKHYLSERTRLDKKFDSVKNKKESGIEPGQDSLFGDWDLKKPD
jgi:hypothetical protein